MELKISAAPKIQSIVLKSLKTVFGGSPPNPQLCCRLLAWRNSIFDRGLCAWDAIAVEGTVLPIDLVPFAENEQTCARRPLKATVVFPEISWGTLPADGWTCPALGANIPIDLR